MSEAARQMLAISQRTAELTKPLGMSLHPGITLSSAPIGALPDSPVIANARILVLPINLNDSQTVRDAQSGHYQGTGEGPSIRFHINDIGILLSSVPLDYTTGEFFHQPYLKGDIDGFPVYQGPGGDVLLLSRNGRLPYKPLTIEQFLSRLIADEEATQAKFADLPGDSEVAAQARAAYNDWQATQAEQLAMMAQIFKTAFPDSAQYEQELEKYRRNQQIIGEGLRKQAESVPQQDPEVARINQQRAQRIKDLKAELAGLSVAQRQSPACASARIRRGSLHILDFACKEGSTPYVVPDQGYFDRSLPAGTVQLIAVTATYGLLPTPRDHELHFTAAKLRSAGLQVDYKAIASLIE
ncbi:DUF3523 domain-containing protein [Bowmanella dokdonensis]|uniref:Uncharacterized protein n=1 Tax=Bowmanella dokdonensis TaxID=751969 RepID=A0A939ISG6_9ALTE|nr:hypothetical protein [Bowmanella dokdonensis]MBN7826411.1 hypothetical protein [Bowmanella dokdonensis]